MTTVTIQQVQAEHARLGQLIAQLQASAPTLWVLREAQIELQAGERYAGLLLDADGLASHHLVLMPGEAQEVSWQAAKDWAAALGGELPTRQEQSLLYANLKGQFAEKWYWSGEEQSDSSSAWSQYFDYGFQYYYAKSYAGRARAVRRFPA
jgi:hypothetical protein